MAASLELPKGIKPLQPVPTISRYFNDADQPYINAAQVISQNPKDARHLGLTVNIQGVEHWFKTGIEDSDLVVKLNVERTSQIENDGSNGKNPFISFSDIYKGSRLIRYSFVNIPNTYSYDIVLKEYLIDNDYFDTQISASKTLDVADATYNRFDSIVVNKAGIISVKKGTPSATPYPPNLDPNDELLIKTILVTANTIAPVDVNTTLVYDENAGSPSEFVATASVGTIDLDSTAQAYSGLKSIYFPPIPSGDYVKFQAPVPFKTSDHNNFNFWLFIPNDATPIIVVSAHRSNGTTIKYVLLNETNGSISPSFNQWQLISIPMQSFAIDGQEPASDIDSMRITMESGNLPFFIDRVFFQKGADEGISEHNDIPGKQGGDETLEEYYHLSKAEYLKLLGFNPSTKQPKDLTYPTIADMIAAPAQLNQVEGVVIRVDDASADTRITFPTGNSKVTYYQKLATSTSTLLTDYTLIGSAFGIINRSKNLTLGVDKKIDMSNPFINLYNFDSPSSVISLLTENSVIGGKAIIRVNANTASNPSTVTVNGSNTGRICDIVNWQDNVDMEIYLQYTVNGLEWWYYTKKR